MPQVIQVANLRKDLQEYMDPDGGNFVEEVAAFTSLLTSLLSTAAPSAKYVVLWDDQDGGDPRLDLSGFSQEELLGSPKDQGMVWRKDGDSYYGATKYTRDWYPVGRFVVALWFGGSPLNSAPGFYVLVG